MQEPPSPAAESASSFLTSAIEALNNSSSSIGSLNSVSEDEYEEGTVLNNDSNTASNVMNIDEGIKATVNDENLETNADLNSNDTKMNKDTSNEENTKANPWELSPNYFNKTIMSPLALMRMNLHTRSGGDLEVMGLLIGYIKGTSFFVEDCTPLPVQGTETRVNAQAEAYEYITEYMDILRESFPNRNCIGWYHSHPGYGCWLSGIDVSTQRLQQKFQDPFVAIVLDPKRTTANNKIEIGAFRTYPKESISTKQNLKSKIDDTNNNDTQTKNKTDTVNKTRNVPEAKAADFGAHEDMYYSLDVIYTQNDLDSAIINTIDKNYWARNLIGSNDGFSNIKDNLSQVVTLSKYSDATKSNNQSIDVIEKSINLAYDCESEMLLQSVKEQTFSIEK